MKSLILMYFQQNINMAFNSISRQISRHNRNPTTSNVPSNNFSYVPQKIYHIQKQQKSSLAEMNSRISTKIDTLKNKKMFNDSVLRSSRVSQKSNRSDSKSKQSVKTMNYQLSPSRKLNTYAEPYTYHKLDRPNEMTIGGYSPYEINGELKNFARSSVTLSSDNLLKNYKAERDFNMFDLGTDHFNKKTYQIKEKDNYFQQKPYFKRSATKDYVEEKVEADEFYDFNQKSKAFTPNQYREKMVSPILLNQNLSSTPKDLKTKSKQIKIQDVKGEIKQKQNLSPLVVNKSKEGKMIIMVLIVFGLLIFLVQLIK